MARFTHDAHFILSDFLRFHWRFLSPRLLRRARELLAQARNTLQASFRKFPLLISICNGRFLSIRQRKVLKNFTCAALSIDESSHHRLDYLISDYDRAVSISFTAMI